MRKKIFLQKGGQQNGHRLPVRAILLAAVALLILVVITPLITRQRAGKDAARKNASERGIVTKEIPKPQGAITESDGGRASSAEAPAGIRNEVPPTLERKPVEGAPTPQPGDKTLETAVASSPRTTVPPGPDQGWIEVKPDAPASAPPASGVPPVKDRKPGAAGTVGPDLASVPPKTPPASDPRTGGERPAGKWSKDAEKAKAKVGAVPSKASGKEAGNVAAPAGKTRFSVQVGLFKNRGNAEEMQRSLQKKGYDVVLKPSTHPNLGEVFVVQLKPVDDMGKASTLVEQIKHEEKVKPMVVKVPGNE